MALKLSSHESSVKLRPHRHTSYALLAVLVGFVGIILSAFSVSSFVSASSGPQAGSVGLSGVMPEKPPATAATITTPSNNQQFATSPVTVSGTCPPNTLIEIYKNNIFAGSTPCTSTNNFTIQIDLLFGQNSLTAIDYDVLNQAGPSSGAVSVNYTAQAPVASSLANFNINGTQLILDTTAVYRGIFPSQQLNVPITIIGGDGPFALNVEWGDNTNQVLPSSNNTTVNATHTYSKPGTYKITIQGSDSQGRVAFLNVAVFVNGQPFVATTNTNKSQTSKFLILWPLYAISATLVISFWLGERMEKHILADSLKQTPSLSHVSHA